MSASVGTTIIDMKERRRTSLISLTQVTDGQKMNARTFILLLCKYGAPTTIIISFILFWSDVSSEQISHVLQCGEHNTWTFLTRPCSCYDLRVAITASWIFDNIFFICIYIKFRIFLHFDILLKEFSVTDRDFIGRMLWDCRPSQGIEFQVYGSSQNSPLQHSRYVYSSLKLQNLFPSKIRLWNLAPLFQR